VGEVDGVCEEGDAIVPHGNLPPREHRPGGHYQDSGYKYPN
jgi:hypothetical protein